MKMLECPKCGADVTDEALSRADISDLKCPKCDYKFEVGSVVLDKSSYQGEDGGTHDEEAYMECPRCGAGISNLIFDTIDYSTLKCANCGLEIKSNTVKIKSDISDQEIDLSGIDSYENKSTGEVVKAIYISGESAKEISDQTRLFSVENGLINIGPFNVASFNQWLLVRFNQSKDRVVGAFTLPSEAFRDQYKYLF